MKGVVCIKGFYLTISLISSVGLMNQAYAWGDNKKTDFKGLWSTDQVKVEFMGKMPDAYNENKQWNAFRVTIPQTVAQIRIHYDEQGNPKPSYAAPYYTDIYMDGVFQGKFYNVNGMDVWSEWYGKPLYNPMQFYVLHESTPKTISVIGASTPMKYLYAKDEPSLKKGDFWYGSGYQLGVTDDGDFAIIDATAKKQWSLHKTYQSIKNTEITSVKFTHKGKLCAYDKENKEIWCSKNKENKNARLVMWGNGNITIDSNDTAAELLWETKTQGDWPVSYAWSIPIDQRTINKTSQCKDEDGNLIPLTIAIDSQDSKLSQMYNNGVFPAGFRVQLSNKFSQELISSAQSPDCFNRLLFSNDRQGHLDNKTVITNLVTDETLTSVNQSYVLQAQIADAPGFSTGEAPIYGEKITNHNSGINYYFYTKSEPAQLAVVLANDSGNYDGNIATAKVSLLESTGTLHRQQTKEGSKFTIQGSNIREVNNIANPGTRYRNYQVFEDGVYLYDSLVLGYSNPREEHTNMFNYGVRANTNNNAKNISHLDIKNPKAPLNDKLNKISTPSYKKYLIDREGNLKELLRNENLFVSIDQNDYLHFGVNLERNVSQVLAYTQYEREWNKAGIMPDQGTGSILAPGKKYYFSFKESDNYADTTVNTIIYFNILSSTYIYLGQVENKMVGDREDVFGSFDYRCYTKGN